MILNNEIKQNFVHNNIIYIHDIFDESIANNVVAPFDQLILSEQNKKEGMIIIDVNSVGGSAWQLRSLLMRVEKAKSLGIIVETRVSAVAYSSGSMLACSGTKGHRFISEYAEHNCHLGSIFLRASNDIILERESQRAKQHFDFVRAIYEKYAKIPNLTKVIKDDSFYIFGKTIIDYQLADKFY
jgi:ATP-dependent protease ClpP protease subunit